MDEEEKNYFHIPNSVAKQQLSAVNQAEIIREVSVSRRMPFSYSKQHITEETRQIYEELTAVSEEIIKCRDAAISQQLG